jgi:hypothetical protein
VESHASNASRTTSSTSVRREGRPAAKSLEPPGATQLLASHLIAVVTLFGAVWLIWLVARWPLSSLYGLPDRENSKLSASEFYVRTNPLDALGYVAKAREALAEPDGKKRAGEYLAIARQLAPVDPQVARAEIEYNLVSGNVAQAFEGAAKVAELSAIDRDEAFALIVRSSDDPAWDQFFRGKIASHWPHLDALVRAACRQNVSVTKLLPVAHEAIRENKLADPTIKCLIDLGISRNQIPAAYWFWLNATPRLPKNIGHVFNGDFQNAPSNIPFDWKIEQGGQFRDGFSARIVGDSDPANLALGVQFNGRPVRSVIAKQILALAPGNYRLNWSVREVSGPPDAYTSWQLSCAQGNRPIELANRNATPGQNAWLLYSATFSVGNDCQGQIISLERAKDRTTAHPTTLQYFDDVTITAR